MDLLIYSVCLGLGIFFLLIAVVVEHVFRDHEADLWTTTGPHPSQGEARTAVGSRLWSPTRIAAFVFGFGAVGVGVNQIPLTSSPYWSVPLALAGGAGLAAMVQALCGRCFASRALMGRSHSGRCDRQAATVVTPIPEAGMGEVAYEQEGTIHTVRARTENGAPLAAGRVVRITRCEGSECFVEQDD